MYEYLGANLHMLAVVSIGFSNSITPIIIDKSTQVHIYLLPNMNYQSSSSKLQFTSVLMWYYLNTNWFLQISFHSTEFFRFHQPLLCNHYVGPNSSSRLHIRFGSRQQIRLQRSTLKFTSILQSDDDCLGHFYTYEMAMDVSNNVDPIYIFIYVRIK